MRRYFHRFKNSGLWEEINDALRTQVRIQEGRDEEPSLVIIDSQTVKGTPTSSESGYDGAKKIKGVKRHLMVDVLGLIICVIVHAANIQERAGAKLLLAKAASKGLPRVSKVLADDGYSGQPMIDYVDEQYGWDFESVKRPQGHQFEVQPKRWVVERSFGILNHFRGLSKNYDYDPQTGEAKIYLASVFYLSRRLTEKKPEQIIDPEIEKRLLQLTKGVTQAT